MMSTVRLVMFLLVAASFTGCSSGGDEGGSSSAPSTKWVWVTDVSQSSPATAIVSGGAWISDSWVALHCSGLACLFDQSTDNYPGVDVTWVNQTTGGSGRATSFYGGGTNWTHAWAASIPVVTGSNTLIISAFDPGGTGGSITYVVTGPYHTPVITSTYPINGAVSVGVNEAVNATFDSSMDPSTITTSSFLLTDGANQPVAGAVSISGTTATFVPSQPLSGNTLYTVTITEGVKDVTGEAMTSNYSWTFTTGTAPDTTPPKVNSNLPDSGSTGAGVTTAILATFSEPMAPATINASSFFVRDAANNAILGTVTYSGTTATFYPSSPLVTSSSYTATITTAAKDLAYNAIAADYSWGFSTGPSYQSAPDPNFGTNGVVFSSPTPYYDAQAKALAIDGTYEYVAGYDYLSGGTEWRIEKRNLSDGALVSGFGTNGAVTSGVWYSCPECQPATVTTDSAYLYVVGTSYSTGQQTWRIEKRSVTDGSLVPGFGSNGVVVTNGTGNRAFAEAIDSSAMYIVGSSYSGTFNWTIEKRNLDDGSLVTGFGTNGVITVNNSNGLEVTPYAIAIDSTYMYVVGYEGLSNWRIEKRNLSDGSLDPGFGLNGVVYGATDALQAMPMSITIDGTSMYVAGWQSGNNQLWRIERRNLANGSLVTSFGSNGVVVDVDSSSPYSSVTSMASDTDSLYLAGYEWNGYQYTWRTEKRNLSDGSLVSGFGTNGVLTKNPTATIGIPHGIAIDATSLFLAGYDFVGSSREWRMEKRYK